MKEQIKVGCCGFPVAKSRYYQNFEVVEIQKTFYQPPLLSTAQRWRKEAPSSFEFTMKVWQLITHPPSSPTYRRLKESVPEKFKEKYGFFKPTRQVFSAWERTKEIALALGAKILIFQCPPSFTPDKNHLENLKKFFQQIKRENFIFVWEPRGRWKEEITKSLCRELNLVHGVDPFKQKPVYISTVNYFRLHGKGGYRYKYSDEDLDYLKRLCGKANITYFMFNNTFMFEDACRFKNLLKLT